MTGRHRAIGDDEPGLLELVRAARPHLIPIGKEAEAWLSRLEERHEAIHRLVERRLETNKRRAPS